MRNKNTKILFLLAAVMLLILFYFFKTSIGSNYIDSNWNSEPEYVSIENGGKESCLQCHINTKGYSKYHNPDIIGCASCHLGNTETTNK